MKQRTNQTARPELNYVSVPPLRDAFYQHSHFSYSNLGADYSVTELLRSPRVVQLQHRYRKELDALPFDHDAIKKMKASFKGTAIHNYFERCLYQFMAANRKKGYIIEQRLWDRICDRKISGKFDCYLNGALYDIKTTSIWKAIFPDYTEWEHQLNLYAYLLKSCGTDVTILFILAWYLDWDKEKVFRDPSYPKDDIDLIHIDKLWQPKSQQEFLHHRIELMKKNEPLEDNELDECTPEEMWAKPTVYAVMRPGQKKAVCAKDMFSEKKAMEYIANCKAKDKEDLYIQERPGGRTKCEEYCHVAPWCSQYKAYMEGKK